MSETRIETPDEVYRRVYEETLKEHGYRFSWSTNLDEEFRCTGTCNCGEISPLVKSRDEASEVMGAHAAIMASNEALKAKTRVIEIIEYKERNG